MASNVLSGVRVVELGDFITAPYCAKILSGWGAEVIKVEAPKYGDKSRSHGPFPGDKPDIEKSGLYLSLNVNKKSVTLDVKDPKGRKIFKELLKDADILVENNLPKTMKEMGLDYESLKKEFPKLIVCSITPFGQTGPYKDYKGNSINAAALAGFSIVQGNPDREPMDHPMSYADYLAGSAGVSGCLGALFARDKTGEGQLCDIVQYLVLNSYNQSRNVWYYKIAGVKSMRSGSHAITLFYPAGIFPCSDGDFCIYSIVYDHWKRLMGVFGDPEWSKDPRFNPPECNSVYQLSQYIDELDAYLMGELGNFTKADLFDKCREAKTPFLPVMDVKDLVESPQSKARNTFLEMKHPVAGTLKYPNAPALMHETPWKQESPAPVLGQHNEEILGKKLGYSQKDLADLKKAGII